MADFPNNPQYQSLLGGILNDSAMPELHQGKLTEARGLLQQAVAHQQAALELDPRNPRYRVFARNHQEMLSLTLIQLGQRNEAEKILRQCISIGEGIASDFPLVPGHREDLAGSYGNLAMLLVGMGPDRREDASRAFDQAGRLFQSLAAEYPGVPSYRKAMASLRTDLGHLLRDARRWTDAEHAYAEAVEIAEAVLAGEPTNAAFKESLASMKENLAIFLVSRPDTPVHDPPRSGQACPGGRQTRTGTPFPVETAEFGQFADGQLESIHRCHGQGMQGGDAGKLHATDRLILAMAHWHLGEKDAARSSFDLAVTEMAKNKLHDETTLRLSRRGGWLTSPGRCDCARRQGEKSVEVDSGTGRVPESRANSLEGSGQRAPAAKQSAR